MQSTGKTWRYLLDVLRRQGAGYLVLVDPDRLAAGEAERIGAAAQSAGVDAFLVGGSLLMRDWLDETVQRLRTASGLPVILFPGGSSQLSPHVDAVLFLSLLSGRNPEFLIGEHVRAAPIIRQYGLEPIPTGYLLIEGGTHTSVQFMSGTQPIPRDKYDIAMAHALAAEYLGMRLLYLEAGSGARQSVPEEMIQAVRSYVSLPLIVGGGIRSPEEAARKVEAGAGFVVTGNVLQRHQGSGLMRAFAEAVHQAGQSVAPSDSNRHSSNGVIAPRSTGTPNP